MAIYRPPKPRWPLAAGGLIAGLLIGLLVGLSAGRSEPDPAEALRELDRKLTEAAAVLEVAGVEYSESVEDGDVVAQAEYDGALDALQRSRDLFHGVEAPLSLVDAGAADEIRRAYDDLQTSMERRVPEARVADDIAALRASLENALG